ncbi:chromosome partitioning protein ParA [Sulfodiicoccus acidiphilus]|uniref:Chromosome partitioning protein ParA n=1 Tax=Sulfodiicoccus acidiphilus TaxID=1670455 RepID=A0A348B4I0_9CREN|nr:ParA family protein [Sulfodiicoccus acidiphilus]BBD73082.1 chromosome partitioning protein ParA [Sulfodiicoccus acidiphilus]GGU05248.1 chromosome partitioning protein ParA [Sulfodiicoccus acidiphilus]
MIVTVVNQKGGVGKTTTSVNLAYVLARTRNVGLLDLDPEGGTTVSFGMRREKVEREIGGKSVNIFDVEVFPAHLGLLRRELEGDVESTVASVRKVAEGFDVLVVDTPPNLGTLSLSATVAADKVVVPVTPQPLTMEVLKNLDSRLKGLNKRALAFTNGSKKPLKEGASSIEFVDVAIPQSRVFTDASRLGVPAVRYDEFRFRNGRLTQHYNALAKVITG